jgi:hypothetical protein
MRYYSKFISLLAMLPVMTYGAETWTAQLAHKFKVAQRAMEELSQGFSAGINPIQIRSRE